jgi:hypothetical protein
LGLSESYMVDTTAFLGSLASTLGRPRLHAGRTTAPLEGTRVQVVRSRVHVGSIRVHAGPSRLEVGSPAVHALPTKASLVRNGIDVVCTAVPLERAVDALVEIGIEIVSARVTLVSTKAIRGCRGGTLS